eukprot:INCI1263.3.p1 GENE.INCI1263.3~~INCI1263.3.p1  ORF type:complete len:586 (-),score=109.43 INCI1263.3:1008-2729(-)
MEHAQPVPAGPAGTAATAATATTGTDPYKDTTTHHSRGFTEKILFLQTNDFHSQMDPLPPRISPPRKALGGLARLQTYFDGPDGRAKRFASPPVVLDCGDVFQGSPFYTFFGGEVDMAALARRNCTAMAVGNHDFDGGLDALRKAAAFAPDTALLCANLVDEEGKLAFQPHIMIRAGKGPPGRNPAGWRVGVTGILGQNAWDVVYSGLRGGLRLTNPLAAARQAANELVAAGAEILVCLSHTGLTALGPSNDMDLARLQLFDLLFSGHDHNEAGVEDDAPPGFRVGRTMVHQGVSSGRAVVWAEVAISIDSSKGFIGRVTALKAGSDPIDDRYAPDADTEEWLDGYRHKPILPDCPNGFHFQLKKQLNCACPTGYDIERSTASLLPTYPCKMAELLKLGCDVDGIQLACLNVGGLRASLPATDNLTWGDIQNIWPWKSAPARCSISKTMLELVLRQNVNLVAAGRATGTFLAFAGLQYEAALAGYGDLQLSFACLDSEDEPFFVSQSTTSVKPGTDYSNTESLEAGSVPSARPERFFVLVGPRFVVEHHFKQQAERGGLKFVDHVRFPAFQPN